MIHSTTSLTQIPQIVQEYERAVIFRLGRLMAGGAKGPGKMLNMHVMQLPSVTKERMVILFGFGNLNTVLKLMN